MNAKQAFARTKTFVTDHKVPIAIVTTAAATAAVMTKAHKGAMESVQEFLDENDLMDKYTDFLTKDL